MGCGCVTQRQGFAGGRPRPFLGDRQSEQQFLQSLDLEEKPLQKLLLEYFHHRRDNSFEVSDEFLQLVRQRGIPNRFRWLAWRSLSGWSLSYKASTWLAIDRRASRRTIDAIGKDLDRTFPTREDFGESRKKQLESLLGGYAYAFPRVGYCQGMNFLAGFLLLISPESSSEHAFFMFVEIMAKFKAKLLFCDGLPLLKLYTYQFQALLESQLPDVHKHFVRENITPELYVTKWFLTLFTQPLPLHVAARLWDIIFCDGLESLVHLALAIIKLLRARLIRRDTEGIMELLSLKGESGLPTADSIVQAAVGFRTSQKGRGKPDARLAKLTSTWLRSHPQDAARLREARIALLGEDGSNNQKLEPGSSAALEASLSDLGGAPARELPQAVEAALNLAAGISFNDSEACLSVGQEVDPAERDEAHCKTGTTQCTGLTAESAAFRESLASVDGNGGCVVAGEVDEKSSSVGGVQAGSIAGSPNNDQTFASSFTDRYSGSSPGASGDEDGYGRSHHQEDYQRTLLAGLVGKSPAARDDANSTSANLGSTNNAASPTNGSPEKLSGGQETLKVGPLDALATMTPPLQRGEDSASECSPSHFVCSEREPVPHHFMMSSAQSAGMDQQRSSRTPNSQHRRDLGGGRSPFSLLSSADSGAALLSREEDFAEGHGANWNSSMSKLLATTSPPAPPPEIASSRLGTPADGRVGAAGDLRSSPSSPQARGGASTATGIAIVSEDGRRRKPQPMEGLNTTENAAAARSATSSCGTPLGLRDAFQTPRRPATARSNSFARTTSRGNSADLADVESVERSARGGGPGSGPSGPSGPCAVGGSGRVRSSSPTPRARAGSMGFGATCNSGAAPLPPPLQFSPRTSPSAAAAAAAAAAAQAAGAGGVCHAGVFPGSGPGPGPGPGEVGASTPGRGASCMVPVSTADSGQLYTSSSRRGHHRKGHKHRKRKDGGDHSSAAFGDPTSFDVADVAGTYEDSEGAYHSSTSMSGASSPPLDDPLGSNAAREAWVSMSGRSMPAAALQTAAAARAAAAAAAAAAAVPTDGAVATATAATLKLGGAGCGDAAGAEDLADGSRMDENSVESRLDMQGLLLVQQEHHQQYSSPRQASPRSQMREGKASVARTLFKDPTMPEAWERQRAPGAAIQSPHRSLARQAELAGDYLGSSPTSFVSHSHSQSQSCARSSSPKMLPRQPQPELLSHQELQELLQQRLQDDDERGEVGREGDQQQLCCSARSPALGCSAAAGAAATTAFAIVGSSSPPPHQSLVLATRP